MGVRPPTGHGLWAAILLLGAVLSSLGHAQEPDPAAVVEAFHAARANAPVWVEDGPEPALSAAGRAVRQALQDAAREGLSPPDYDVPAAATPQALDRAVTATLLAYLTDLQAGRVAPRKADPDLFVYRREVDGERLLQAVADAPDPARTLADLAPANPVYRRLRRLLLEYRGLVETGGWGTLPGGETLKPGMTDVRVGMVRRRLAATGDLTMPADPTDRYDETLEVAVRAFQRRHGLDADGSVGKRTVAALNVPVEQRVRQIELNMERFRWMPDEFGDDHVFVNLAGFELDYVMQGVTRLSMRVVVGRRLRGLCRMVRRCAAGGRRVDRLDHRGRGPVPLSAAPGPGQEERPRPGEVHVSQPIRHLPARHAGARALPPVGAGLQFGLHPAGKAAGAGRGPVARRPAGSGTG